MGTSLSSPRATAEEGSAESSNLADSDTADNATRHSTRERTQTDFLSPTFTPQKRGGRIKTDGSPSTFVRRWDGNFEHLVQYKQAHGDCRVPPSYKTDGGVALGKWVENQKGFYKRNRLPLERYEKLVKLGVTFAKKSNSDDATAFPAVSSPKKAAPAGDDNATPKKAIAFSPVIEERWENFRKQLISYKDEVGHANVPSTYKDRFLAKWVENQRMFFHKKKLSQERIELLQEVGFEFGASKQDRWDFHLQELLQYKEKHEHCDVPQKYSANPSLGRWARKQRERRRSNKLPEDQYEKLKGVGFWEYGFWE